MTRLSVLALLSALSCLVCPRAFAASTASHTVTVNVSAINDVAIVGGNVALNITSTSAVSDSSTSITWSTNESSRKITVATDLSTIRYPLTVTPGTVTGVGTKSSTLTLSTTAQDIVSAISLTDGSCGLTYSASAERSAGTGTDTHTVTYTITAA